MTALHASTATTAAPDTGSGRLPRRAGSVVGAVVMLVSAAAFVIPLLWLLLAPTHTRDRLTSGSSLTFGSFADLGRSWSNLMTFGDGLVLKWLANSLGYSMGAVVLSLLMVAPAGYALAMYDFPGRRLVLNATLVTMIIPQAALILPLYLEMVKLQLIDSIWSVVLPSAFFPFGVYLTYLYYNDNLPRSLVEAARLDGASEWRAFLSLGLPLGRQALGLTGFFCFVQAWNQYFLPFVMLSDDGRYNLQLGLQTLISSTGAVNPSYGATTLPIHQPEAALAALITVGPILVIFLVAQRYLRAGQIGGAVKG
ncbi:carbohydrate ABC transporter permease [Planotetraspora sp. A-T 1434]|uniref:carbohydrate ABC transporter permease n=1 Tax=Planotetraspora sp. A-T 1434 TaxID=2979219 RepID=UPI0021C11E20|nr:carbohydrate ABC transporter permease [Planotetraspora sp. A-T 1434]MCT9931289.1 carbohydrate ABC transporter permease [Planotetraspora sp. A-T 1434]